MAEQSISQDRICAWCEIGKPLTAFYVDRGRFRAVCKECWLGFWRLSLEEQIVATEARKARAQQRMDAYLTDCRPFLRLEGWPDNEEWRPIPGYLGYYEASSMGRVRSLWFTNHRIARWRPRPLVLKPYTNQAGYPSVTLVRDGKHFTENVHSLVLRAFRGERPDGYVGGHRDGNPGNNRLDNLEWITWIENEADKRRHGRNLSGSRNHQAKLNEEAVKLLREDRCMGMSYRQLSAKYGVSTPVIAKVIKRQAWRHVE